MFSQAMVVPIGIAYLSYGPWKDGKEEVDVNNQFHDCFKLNSDFIPPPKKKFS
jgi:hypothetical protein